MNTIKVLGSVLTDAVDSFFNEVGRVFTVYLENASGSISGASVVVDFSSATMVGNYATLVLDESKYIALDSGTNVTKVSLGSVQSSVQQSVFIENVTPVTFTANGTYTISQITIKVGF